MMRFVFEYQEHYHKLRKTGGNQTDIETAEDALALAALEKAGFKLAVHIIDSAAGNSRFIVHELANAKLKMSFTEVVSDDSLPQEILFRLANLATQEVAKQALNIKN